MKLKFITGLLPLLILSVGAWRFSRPEPVAAPAVAPSPAVAPLPEEVIAAYAPFDIGQTFVIPAGPRGLEYTAEARRLEGRKVCVRGHMVKHYQDDTAVFLLTTFPMVLNMAEFGLADDLPMNAVHVILPILPGMAPDWVRQPLAIYGTLELGPREELDRRISQIRVRADHVTAADGRTVIELRRSVVLQPGRIRAGKVLPQTLSAKTPE